MNKIKECHRKFEQSKEAPAIITQKTWCTNYSQTIEHESIESKIFFLFFFIFYFLFFIFYFYSFYINNLAT